MSVRPALRRETEKKIPPAGQRESSLEPIDTDQGISADNRYAPASGILAPVHAPVGDVQ
jgi:hypothetical protein